MPLLVTGTIGIDSIETPTQKQEGVVGGSCAHFAAAASLYGPVRLVAAVGGDWPESHRQALRAFKNIDMSGLEERPQGRTFAWGGKYLDDVNQRETIYTELGVLDEAPPEVPASFQDSDTLFLANSHPAEQLTMLERVPGQKLCVADTMNLWIDIAQPELRTLLARVDGLVLNDQEAIELTGCTNAVSAGDAILEMGPSFVVVKKGEHGCLLRSSEGTVVLPAFPARQKDVVDPTGAGDSFAGGMMGHLARTGDHSFETLREALAWGTITASFAIRDFGLGGLAGLSTDDLKQRLADFRKVSSF
ncbi:MAG: PfkB family carbohydrate kinase [Phycisphaerales bacterium]|nr:PfkB family carbohydrate kinase [Phycisphaerales bacterium]